MPNIAAVLKDEVSRIARKELRGENLALKKSSAQYRSDIAELKRRVQALERLVAKSSKQNSSSVVLNSGDSADKPQRFSAKGLAGQRRRLGLSAADVAKILGVSALSIYKWEGGTTRPRASQMPGLLHLRSLSKKQAAAALEAIQ